MDDQAAREHVERVEALLGEVDALPDAAARETATNVIQALVELYGEALARIVARGGEDGATLSPASLAEDELVEHLLLLHDLHPVPVERRVLGALDEVRPYLEAHDGDVELLGIEDGVARLRLRGNCHGCPASTQTLRHAIEEAIHRAAPDVAEIDAQGVAEPGASGLLQIETAPPATPSPAPPYDRCPAPLRIEGT